MFCFRRRRSKSSVYYPPQQLNQQYYQNQQPQQTYVLPENPQTYQTGGYTNYGNQGYSNYDPSGGAGSAQQQPYYSREQEYDVVGEDFSRPEGPPPAHTKS